MSANLSFSYSKMGMYKECPQKYKFRYILKIPEKPKYYFAFGSALHKVMEFLYSSGRPPFPPLETALKFFKTDWDSTTFDAKGYADKEKEREGFAEGARIIKAYYEKHKDEAAAPLAAEFRSTVNVDGLSVISILDRIDYLGDGKISILDYKTGKTLNREPEQLMMYQKLMDGNPALTQLVKTKDPGVSKVKVASMMFYHLPTLKQQIFEPAAQDEISNFWAGVLKVAEDIQAGKFAPDPGETKCRWCDYKLMCPVWNTELSVSPATAPKTETLTPAEELAQKIDAYGKAAEDIKKLKTEIMKLMNENSFTRHYGKQYEAALETQKTTDFKDRQKTLDILKKHNLLPRVLTPTLSSVLKLLDAPGVTPEQKKELQNEILNKETTALVITKTEN